MSSSAARRGVAQRVLILSRPRRFSRVFGGTRHPALRVRQVSPSTAFAPNDPITREDICVYLKRYCDYYGIELPVIKEKFTFTDEAPL